MPPKKKAKKKKGLPNQDARSRPRGFVAGVKTDEEDRRSMVRAGATAKTWKTRERELTERVDKDMARKGFPKRRPRVDQYKAAKRRAKGK